MKFKILIALFGKVLVRSRVALAAGTLFSLALSAAAQTQCIETNGVKFILPPQVDGGWDVKDDHFVVLADDFYCTNSGSISDIHLWGSWLNDLHGIVTNFTLTIYDDVPASTNATGQVIPSHPGTNVLWTESFVPGQYSENTYGIGSEQFFDPSITNIIGTDTTVWYYCFYPSQPFKQQGSPTAPTNYWLSVFAEDIGNGRIFGWKTALGAYNDAAVWRPVGGGNWTPMYRAGQPINLAFKLTTATNEPPPESCIETNGTKYVQWPNLFGGLDVWNSGPWMLADDFVCTNKGPVSDIHIWGSWLNNLVTNNLTFLIAIYDDVPVSPTNPFSHPGILQWQQQFGPGQYLRSFWANGDETFLDPGPPNIMGPDTQIWYYCFYPYPTNTFIQQGDSAQSKTYWLAVYTQIPVGTPFNYGWKTTTNVQHDISVFAPWPGSFPPGGAPWASIRTPVGQPLDLSFKITTDTNCGPAFLSCPTNKTVECGSNWTFDQPTVVDPCCGTNFTLTLKAVTNNVCPQLITATWTVTNCLGLVTFCSHIITVVDTTPPTITCATNKTVECGTAWNFDPPTATDLCCTNVAITDVSTITNNPFCPLIVTHTWKATDCCSNVSLCSQTVTVRDTTPPSVVCPSNIVIKTCDTNSVMVTWTNVGADTCSSVTVTSSPPSGSLFAPNTTNTVTVIAHDACGNSNSCTFTVSVIRPVISPIAITHTSTNLVVLTWTEGILQVSTNVIGPYVDVGGATSPYTNNTVPPMKYYRLRCSTP